MKIVLGSEIDFVPASHEDPCDPGCLKRVLADREDLVQGQVQMVNWSRLPVGKSFQPHYHEDMQEVFVIICGQVAMTVDEQTVSLVGGDAIVIDPREIHQMINRGDTDVQYLVFGISQQQRGRTVVVDLEP